MLGAMAIAQEEPVDEEPIARRYTVEIVIFAYAEDVSVGTERFVADKRVIADDERLTANGEGTLSDDSLRAPESRKLRIRELEFVRQPKADSTMTDIIGQLERLDAYQPIMHVAWTQRCYPKEKTPAIQLQALGEPPAGLGGSFTLYLSRYLHLVVDLALDADNDDYDTRAAIAEEKEPAISFGDSRLQDDGFYGATTGIIRYRLQENRIVKNGELRYFDHPKFGVIARVTRVEEEQEEIDDETYNESRELLGRIGQ
jgi:hypothetical protein